MALHFLRKIQLGKESTRGVAVPATKVLFGDMQMMPDLKWFRPTGDERYSLADNYRAAIAAKGCKVRLENITTYEQFIHWLAMGVKGSVTPTTPIGGTLTRDWTFTPNLLESNVQDSYTLEFGDEETVYQSKFTLLTDLLLELKTSQPLVFIANLFGHYPSKVSFTPSSVGDAHEITAVNTKLYIDDSWVNIGQTQVNDLLTQAWLRFTTGLKPSQWADGNLDFDDISEGARHLELEFLYAQYSPQCQLEYDAALANEPRAIRIELIGPLIETGFNYKLTIDTIGKYVNQPNIFERQWGENTLRLKFESEEDLDHNEFSFMVRNKETSL